MEMQWREFTDDRGAVWRVWPVDPDSLERRIGEDPVLSPVVERRSKRESRLRVSNPLMVHGWLAFESHMERRRLAPIPDAWVEMDEAALRGLLAQATPVGTAARILE